MSGALEDKISPFSASMMIDEVAAQAVPAEFKAAPKQISAPIKDCANDNFFNLNIFHSFSAVFSPRFLLFLLNQPDKYHNLLTGAAVPVSLRMHLIFPQ